MAKKAKVNFSIELLKSNRKYHKEQIKKTKLSKREIKNLSYNLGAVKHYEGRNKMHKRYYDDLTLAIKILSGKKKK